MMPQILNPEIFEEKDLCLYDKKELLKNSKLIYKQDDVKIYWKTADKDRIIDEDYFFLILKTKLVTVVEFWFHEIYNLQIPKIKNTTTLKKHRGCGFATLIYNQMFQKFGCLMSDVTLNGLKKKPNGSYKLWLNLIKLNTNLIFDEKEQKFLPYSKYVAFESERKAYRRILIFQDKYSLYFKNNY